MNILFLTLSNYNSINISGIYADLLRVFVRHGHKIYIISALERRTGENERVVEEEHVTIVKTKILNMQKTNIFEKGISMMTIDSLYLRAIKRHFGGVKFDLVLYPTPPITLLHSIQYIKSRDKARTYLLLKDIFPQNAVDMGMMSKKGFKRLIYSHFRKKEQKLYALSDHIGCMSQANVDYLLKHNPQISPRCVDICPNSIEVIDKSVGQDYRRYIRDKYGIPHDKKVFVYGGNLGRPQGIDFIIECLKSQKENKNAYFLLIGDGTEYGKLENYVNSANQRNLRLMKRLPKDDYDTMVGACDVGLIFLDHRFTIPNFPSRLLSYMQAKIPVIACTDLSTDIGRVIVDGGFGWWCESDDVKGFGRCVQQAMQGCDTTKEWQYLCDNYSVEQSYAIIDKWMR